MNAPDHPTLVERARQALTAGDGPAASEALRLAEAALPEDAWSAAFCYQRGRFEMRAGEPRAAADWFRRCADREDDAGARVGAYLSLGLAEVEDGRADEGLAALETARTLAGEHDPASLPEVSGALGVALLALDRTARARDAFEQAWPPDRTGRVGINNALNLAVVRLMERDLAGARALAAGHAADVHPSIAHAVAIVGLALAAAEGDAAAFDDAFRTVAVGGWVQLRGVVASRALEWAAVEATRRGRAAWLTRAMRLRRSVLVSASTRGRRREADRQARAIRRLVELGAPVLLGPFHLGARLGTGVFGEVWAGSAPDGTRVAVKVVGANPDAARLLDHELRTVAGLDHGCIQRVLHHGRVDAAASAADPRLPIHAPYVASALVDGGTLLDRVGRAGWPEVQGLLLDVLAALAHAHARGVVHLDVKPSNVLVTSAGRAVLADFGLARATGHIGPGTGSGTPLYMAPELYGGRPVGPWTDLYAVGCVAFELATGRPVFSASSHAELRRDHLERRAELPHDTRVPAGLGDWLARMLAKDPAGRFPTAARAARALRALGPDRPDPVDSRVPPAGAGLVMLRRPRLVGRTAERAFLLDRVERATGGQAATVRIEGAPGLGASALARWTAETASEAGLDPVVVVERWDDRSSVDARGLVVLAGGPPAPGEETLTLGPLADADQAALVAGLLPLAPALAARVVERTAGRPRFAVQLAIHLVERDRLVPGPDGLVLRGRDEALPADPAELWDRRCEAVAHALGPAVRRAVGVAARCGARVQDLGAACAADGVACADEARTHLLDTRLAEPVDDGFAWVDEALRSRFLRW